MKGIIFAAGIGKRMGALTKDIPKCLLPVCGETMLSRWLDTLLALDIQKIYFNTHHHAEKVRNHVAKRYPAEVMSGQIVEWYEPDLLGSMGTIDRYRQESSDTILIYCDVWTQFDIGPMIAYHIMAKTDLTLGVFETDAPKRCGILDVDGTDVVGFAEKPKRPKGNLAWSGLAVASRNVLRPMWGGEDIGTDWIPRLIQNSCYSVRAYPIEGHVIDIGSALGYKTAKALAYESIR